jgi:hypothetical protein
MDSEIHKWQKIKGRTDVGPAHAPAENRIKTGESEKNTRTGAPMRPDPDGNINPNMKGSGGGGRRRHKTGGHDKNSQNFLLNPVSLPRILWYAYNFDFWFHEKKMNPSVLSGFSKYLNPLRKEALKLKT